MIATRYGRVREDAAHHDKRELSDQDVDGARRHQRDGQQ